MLTSLPNCAITFVPKARKPGSLLADGNHGREEKRVTNKQVLCVKKKIVKP